MIGALLAAGAEVNARASYGVTPLHAAAANGTPAVIAALLAAGADASVVDDDGKTAFDHAEDNAAIKGTAVYRVLSDGRFP